MSTAAEQIVVSSATVERRFYERVPPSGVVGIALGEENPGMLLNVSENGLLVSAPSGLARDAVLPLSLRLDGLPNFIEVIGRVVWTAESNRAGIQLLNLRDHDREQIRMWATSGRTKSSEAARGVVREDERLKHVDERVKRTRERRNFTRVSLAVGGAIAVVVLAMGLSLRGGVLRTWLSRSSKASLKIPGATVGAEAAGSGRNESDVAASAAAHGKTSEDGGAASKVVDGKQSAGAATLRTGPDGRGDKEAGPSGAMARAAVRKNLSGKKSGAKANSSADLAEASLAKSGTASDASGAQGTAAKKSAEDGDAAKPEGGSPLPIPLDTLDTNDATVGAATIGGSISADANSRVGPEVNPKSAPLQATNPVVIQMEGRKSEVVEVTLPNGRGETLLSLPGERVIQSAAVTMHVQRSVLVAGGQGWWSANRKKKVVLGELRERVDPQTPRVQSERGGWVSVRAMIAKDGRIERVRPVNGSMALVPSVVRAIREWRFEPTLVDGKAVETGVLLSVEFHTTANGASKP